MDKKVVLTSKMINDEFIKYNWQNENYKIIAEQNFNYLIFDKLIFQFHYNKMYNSLSCSFYKRNETDNNKIDIVELVDYKIINIDEILYDDLSSVDIIEYLRQYVKIIHDYLLQVIKGDVKVFEKVEIIRKNTYYIQNYYDKDFIFETEAYKKMIGNEENWKDYLNH